MLVTADSMDNLKRTEVFLSQLLSLVSCGKCREVRPLMVLSCGKHSVCKLCMKAVRGGSGNCTAAVCSSCCGKEASKPQLMDTIAEVSQLIKASTSTKQGGSESAEIQLAAGQMISHPAVQTCRMRRLQRGWLDTEAWCRSVVSCSRTDGVQKISCTVERVLYRLSQNQLTELVEFPITSVRLQERLGSYWYTNSSDLGGCHVWDYGYKGSGLHKFRGHTFAQKVLAARQQWLIESSRDNIRETATQNHRGSAAGNCSGYSYPAMTRMYGEAKKHLAAAGEQEVIMAQRRVRLRQYKARRRETPPHQLRRLQRNKLKRSRAVDEGGSLDGRPQDGGTIAHPGVRAERTTLPQIYSVGVITSYIIKAEYFLHGLMVDLGLSGSRIAPAVYRTLPQRAHPTRRGHTLTALTRLCNQQPMNTKLQTRRKRWYSSLWEDNSLQDIMVLETRVRLLMLEIKLPQVLLVHKSMPIDTTDSKPEL